MKTVSFNDLIVLRVREPDGPYVAEFYATPQTVERFERIAARYGLSAADWLDELADEVGSGQICTLDELIASRVPA